MTVLANAYVVTMDDAGTEIAGGWIRIDEGFVAEVGAGEPPEPGDDLHGTVVTPALINTHHHLFQTPRRSTRRRARGSRSSRCRAAAPSSITTTCSRAARTG